MQTINIHQAKTHLSQLVDQAVKGKSFIIAKAGKPLVKVERLDLSNKKKRKMGFLKGQFQVPNDFDAMGREEIEHMFYDEKK